MNSANGSADGSAPGGYYTVDPGSYSSLFPDPTIDPGTIPDPTSFVDDAEREAFNAAKGAAQKAYNDLTKNLGNQALKIVGIDPQTGKDIIAVGSEAIQTAQTWGATGAVIGSAIPIIGNFVGGVLGEAGGAIYGAIDALNKVFSRPKYSEADYTAMKAACRSAGGSQVPGVPPDQPSACRFADGSTDGGMHPTWDPGKKAAWIAQQAIDAGDRKGTQAEFSSWSARQQIASTMIDTAIQALSTTPGFSPVDREALIQKILDFNRATWDVRTSVMKAADGGPYNEAADRAFLEGRIPQPKPFSAAQVSAMHAHAVRVAGLLGGSWLPQSPGLLAAKVGAILTGHAVVVSAALQNTAAVSAIQNTIAGARAAAPGKAVQANVMSQAQKLLTRARFVDKWVHGIVTP